MSDLMLIKSYAEAHKNRDWQSCDIISDDVKELTDSMNELKKDMDILMKAIEDCLELGVDNKPIDWNILRAAHRKVKCKNKDKR